MSATWEGCSPGKKELKLILNEKKIIIEDIGVYDGELGMTYRRETTLQFKTEDNALEYYYKNRDK